MQTLKSVTVADVMTRDVFAVVPDTTILAVARLLAQQHISGLPVIDATGRPVGVVTLADLVDPDRDRTSAAAKTVFYRVTDRIQVMAHEEPRDGVVNDVMSPFVLAIRPEASVLDAVKLMVADDVHRLLVIESDKLVGIITSMDVMRVLSRLEL